MAPVISSGPDWDRLFEVAAAQAGYFTTQGSVRIPVYFDSDGQTSFEENI